MVRVGIFLSFILATSCSYTQDKEASVPEFTEVSSFDKPFEDGKLDTLAEMSSLFEEDTLLNEVVIANSANLKEALQLNLSYLQKKGSGTASPQRSLYYNFKDLRVINEYLQKNASNTLDVSKLRLQKIWGSDHMGNVQFTSYYIPVIEVRREKDSIYKYPIYKKPGSSYLSRLSREQIDEKNMLSGKGLELAYAKNYFDVYSMQVQGSGYVKFKDGTQKLFSYGGKNYRSYYSIGRHMIDQEYISKEDISMQSIKAWFEEHPDSTSLLMKNASYVFFKESFKEPSGAAGVPLIDFVSIASDFRFLPKGAILLGQVPVLDSEGYFVKHEYRILMVHDTGGAIKGAGHVDLYAGVGEDAGEYAGRMKHYGRLWLILPQ
ncbi:MAG: murein transglycosylase A [Crocinitomicaceae bacterium]